MTAPIDAILGILVQQGATELRVGTGRVPRMFQHGVQKRLTLPETSDEELRHLMGTLLTHERETELAAKRRVEFEYDTGALGAYQVVMVPRADGVGYDAVFVGVTTRRHEPAHPSVPMTPIAPTGSAPARATELSTAHEAPLTVGTPTAPTELAALLARAVNLRASDIHMRTGEIAYARVDGRLRALSDDPTDVERLLDGCIGDDARERLARGSSVDLAIDLLGTGRFRVNVYRSADGLAAAFRALALHPPSLGSLGLPVPLDDLVDLPHGLVLVCGPTGTGKSTTLAALAAEALRRRSVVVVTLEDPIEYVLVPPGTSSIVRQRQIGRDVRDVATGLRDALREDPDILVVGEMRDPETISLTLTAAETGHLVLASLHSRSSASAVERIVDTYAPERQAQIRVQLADSLRAAIAQRLLPRAKGSGRVAAFEVLRGTHAIASAIRDGKTAQIASIVQSSRREGMLPLERCLADMVRAGQITMDAARAVANDLVSLDGYAK